MGRWYNYREARGNPRKSICCGCGRAPASKKAASGVAAFAFAPNLAVARNGSRDQSVERRSSGALSVLGSDLTGSSLALSTAGVSTRADTSARASAERGASSWRMQRARPRHGARHQHLRRTLVAEIAIGEAHAGHRAAERAVIALVEIEARLERKALDGGADGLAANLQRIAGQAHMADRARAAELDEPAAPRSSRMRPAPRVPSKQVKANTLPATNLRASSAFIIPASAGTIIAPAVTAPKTKRASMSYSNLPRARAPAVYGSFSLPAAYHTNRGNIGAAWLVKSERR